MNKIFVYKRIFCVFYQNSGCGAVGSISVLGTEGHVFDSRHPEIVYLLRELNPCFCREKTMS